MKPVGGVMILKKPLSILIGKTVKDVAPELNSFIDSAKQNNPRLASSYRNARIHESDDQIFVNRYQYPYFKTEIPIDGCKSNTTHLLDTHTLSDWMEIARMYKRRIEGGKAN